jgi:hypothetical protein
MIALTPTTQRLRLRRLSATFLLAALAFLASSCANFRKLGKDLKMLDNDYRISGIVPNADDYKVPVRAVVVEWDPSSNQVFSGDRVDLTSGGAYLFLVESPLNQYVAAYADQNRDGKYNPGEAAWIHSGADGKPSPVSLSNSQRLVRVKGMLASATSIPAGLMQAVAAALGGKKVEDVIRKHGIRFALGETAELDDPAIRRNPG